MSLVAALEKHNRPYSITHFDMEVLSWLLCSMTPTSSSIILIYDASYWHHLMVMIIMLQNKKKQPSQHEISPPHFGGMRGHGGL